MSDRKNSATPWLRLRQGLQASLARLSPREQRAVSIAAWVVGLGLIWWLAVAPAWTTLRQAPERHKQLDAQLGHMRRLAATADGLRGQNTTQPLGRDAAMRALELATNTALGGTAQLTAQGDRVTITLRGAPPEALAQWLNQVRVNARLVPVQAELKQTAEPAGWTGQLVLAGPGLGSGN
jgi:general secretion pathway protein M